MAELVGLPELVEELLLLHVPGAEALFQPCGLPLGFQHRLVALLEPGPHGGALLLQVELALLELTQAVLTGRGL